MSQSSVKNESFPLHSARTLCLQISSWLGTCSRSVWLVFECLHCVVHQGHPEGGVLLSGTKMYKSNT